MIAMNHGSTSSDEPDDADERAAARSSQRARAVDDRERDRRQPDEHQDQRPLEQHAGRKRGPEDRRQHPADRAHRAAPLLRQIGARHRAHGRDAR